MNLQVCAPHQECVYNCPFCVARGHKHKYHFKDIYKDGLNQDYFNALKRTIKTCNIDTVIITGAARIFRYTANTGRSFTYERLLEQTEVSFQQHRRL